MSAKRQPIKRWVASFELTADLMGFCFATNPSYGLCAVFFAWIGVQRQREHIRLAGELFVIEIDRKSLTDDNIVPGMEAVRKQHVAELEADIAKRREALGLPAAK